MAQTNGSTMAVVLAGGVPAPGLLNGAVRACVERVTLASQPAADTIVVGRIPKGAKPLGFILSSSVSLGGTATIAIGTAAAPAKYRAAAVFTAVDTPTLVGIATALHAALAADEDILITIAAAALPASGALNILTLYAVD